MVTYSQHNNVQRDITVTLDKIVKAVVVIGQENGKHNINSRQSQSIAEVAKVLYKSTGTCVKEKVLIKLFWSSNC